VSAHGNRRRRRSDHGGHEEHADERWLLTYADMITLLMALFIVMWSISAVNISKFEELKVSLRDAFNGNIQDDGSGITPGGESVLQPTGQQQVNPAILAAQAVAQAPQIPKVEDQLAKHELASLRRVQAELKAWARQHGVSEQVRATIDERGLVVRLLTDEVLFDPGDAVVKTDSDPLLHKIGQLLASGRIDNPIRVEGHTDDTPIRTAEFPSNWELSAARATAVLRKLLDAGLNPGRVSVSGYGEQKPISSNDSSTGRAKNRRVEIVVLRQFTGATAKETE
jgi:chemotaxis protein MotB